MSPQSLDEPRWQLIVDLLNELQCVLEEEQVHNCLQITRYMCDIIRHTSADASARNRSLIELQTQFAFLLSVRDGLGELEVWDEDLTKAMQTNRKISDLRNNLSKLLLS